MLELLLFVTSMGVTYDSSFQTIFNTPTVCTVPPDDPLISEQIKKNYLKETKNAVLEWQYMIQAKAEKPANYKINYLEERYPYCDIVIIFKRYIDDQSIPDYEDILGSYSDGIIEIYFQEFTSCGSTGYTKCFWDEAVPAREISVTAKHEFGHALGLGHEDTYDSYGNAKSIMNIFTNRINDQNKITDMDITNVLSIYGTDGFNSYNGKITPWIIQNAKQYSMSLISDNDFAVAIRHLIEIKMIYSSSRVNNTTDIPEWLKSNAGWWADGKITDADYLDGIQYLIEKGIVKV